MAIEGGLFLLMTSIAVLLVVLNIRYKEYFYFVSTFLFLVLGFWLFQGEIVTFTTETFDGTTWINSTQYLIGNSVDTYNVYSPWLGLAFIMAAIILSFVALLGLTTDPLGSKGKFGN